MFKPSVLIQLCKVQVWSRFFISAEQPVQKTSSSDFVMCLSKEWDNGPHVPGAFVFYVTNVFKNAGTTARRHNDHTVCTSYY